MFAHFVYVKQIFFFPIIIFRCAVSAVVVLLSSKSDFSPSYAQNDVHHPSIPRLTPTTHTHTPPSLVSLSPYDTSLLTRSSAGPHSNQTFLLTPASLCVTDLQDVPPDTCTHAETHTLLGAYEHLPFACGHLTHGQP